MIQVDFNHPLAGRQVLCKYTVVKKYEELAEIINALFGSYSHRIESVDFTDDGETLRITLPEICKVDNNWTFAKLFVVTSLREATEFKTIVFEERYEGRKPEEELAESEEETPAELVYDVGSVTVVQKMLQLPDESRRLLIRGAARIRIEEYVQTEPFQIARVSVIKDVDEDGEEIQAMAQSLINTFQQIVQLSPILPEEAYLQALNVPSRSGLCDLAASALDVDVQVKQAILEAANVGERLRLVNQAVHEELVRLQAAERVSSEVREEIEKVQRDYFLRQQLKAIQRELGEEGETEEVEQLRRRVTEASLSEPARETAEHELNRLAQMNPAAAEYSVVRTYLEWILELPWQESSQEHIEIEKAEAVLDEDHYDLADVKDRILEYLAVRQLKPDLKGPILCFIGPPGVGKTSLGRSIARATGREFLRASLGGIRDEAEIRGHRRTYVGALPGRIIQGLRTVGTSNPVFMLDEIDKVGTDFRGDPSSALLEVLDPEQNDSFSDHYLEIPFDLSRVMFITTGNVTATIPPALLDRMELLRLPGYTDEEKVHIARRYLIPRQREQHGLNSRQVRITAAALNLIIRGYTREAGVRNLEREVGTICRKLARRVVAGETELPSVRKDNLQELLGHQRYFAETAERITTPGVACGLAWTQAGGEILFIEATKMPGKKSLTLTGQLGDVMQESAQAALSWVRSNAQQLGIPPDFYDQSDIHVHVPSGATPKDGPSAGVAMATALTSLLTGRLVKSNVGMTGEITLRGKVLPVGGIKEKILAARRSGLDTVILPARNEGDVLDLDADSTEGLNFVYTESIDQVIEAALAPNAAPA